MSNPTKSNTNKLYCLACEATWWDNAEPEEIICHYCNSLSVQKLGLEEE